MLTASYFSVIYVTAALYERQKIRAELRTTAVIHFSDVCPCVYQTTSLCKTLRG